jgi:hypothetical protein
MNLDAISQGLRDNLEAFRGMLMQQGWLGFAHDWIAAASLSTIWTVLVAALAPIVLLSILLWPTRRPKATR